VFDWIKKILNGLQYNLEYLFVLIVQLNIDL
jgi:hypothetical protein